MAVLGVELVDLGIHFENCGSIYEPVLGLILSLDIDGELGQEGLDITLVVDSQNTSF